MTNHRRSPGNGVAGPLIASLSALVLLVGIGWFVLRQTDSSKVTSQADPITSMATASDDASSATPVRPTSPSYTPRRTPSTTPSTAKSVTPKPTRTTSPSRGSTRTPKPTTSTTSPKPSHSATPTPTPTPTKTTKTSKPTSGPAEAQVLDLTNQERAKAGCGPLRTNKPLTQAAEAHAADMVAKHYFAHDSLDGRSPFDRMKAAGFRGGAMAENIAVGYTSAASVVKGWMNSPGHRANILNCSYTMIGIGYNGGQVKPDWGNGSWVQDFGG